MDGLYHVIPYLKGTLSCFWPSRVWNTPDKNGLPTWIKHLFALLPTTQFLLVWSTPEERWQPKSMMVQFSWFSRGREQYLGLHTWWSHYTMTEILRNFSFPAWITPERSIYTQLSLRLPVDIWNTQAVANVHFQQWKRPVLLWTLTHSENNLSICIILNISSLNASLKSQQVGNFLHSKTQYEPLFYNMLASTVCSSVHVCFCYDVEYLC